MTGLIEEGFGIIGQTQVPRVSTLGLGLFGRLRASVVVVRAAGIISHLLPSGDGLALQPGTLQNMGAEGSAGGS
jgi:hypothetical protein